MKEKGGISEAMLLIAEVAQKRGMPPANSVPGAVLIDHVGSWMFALNGHKKSVQYKDMDIPPFHCYAEHLGWPAGLFSAFGGKFAAGEAVNEDAMIAALMAEVGKASR